MISPYTKLFKNVLCDEICKLNGGYNNDLYSYFYNNHLLMNTKLKYAFFTGIYLQKYGLCIVYFLYSENTERKYAKRMKHSFEI
jgi:hypothetical protein